jgi:extracellular factor (EF) 3-hydroxypalmitic acid methyl ester biosynthesis protein
VKIGKKSRKRITILSVACGPAYEIRDILLTPKDCDQYHFTLLDQDKNALHEAAELISEIEKSLNRNIKVDYINESVRYMLSTSELEKNWGRFDFIYSMGLFDYLTPPVAKSVIHKLFRLLEPGGELIIGNFHISNPSKIYMEYWLSWVLYHRKEEEFQQMIEDEPSAITDVLFEETGSQMFLNVKKKA